MVSTWYEAIIMFIILMAVLMCFIHVKIQIKVNNSTQSLLLFQRKNNFEIFNEDFHLLGEARRVD